MRILLTSDHYPPFVGGVQRQTRALALELTARGHEVCVATVWQDDQPAFEDADGFPVHRVRQLRSLPVLRARPRRRYQPPFPDPVTAWQLRKLVRGFRPDVVHASGWFSYATAAALPRRGGPPLVVSARDYGFSCANASLLHRGAPCSGPAPRKCLDCSRDHFGGPRGVVAWAGVTGSAPLLRRRLAGLHSVSRFVREMSERDFLEGRAVEQAVIPSFRIDDTKPGDEEFLNRLPNEPFLLFVGALRRVKGVETLWSAYRELSDAPPLVMLGTKEWDCPEHPPEGVHLLGPASHPTVLAAWDRSLLGVMPSLWPEPFGSVVHEAMSCGRAVIGTTPGGHADMIEPGVTGLLVPPNDVDALRAAIQQLLDDPQRRERMGEEARRRAEAFSAAAVVPRFEALYAAVAPWLPTASLDGRPIDAPAGAMASPPPPRHLL